MQREFAARRRQSDLQAEIALDLGEHVDCVPFATRMQEGNGSIHVMIISIRRC